MAAGRQTTLWVREDDVLADIRAGRGNRFLPGCGAAEGPDRHRRSGEAASADALLLAVPAQVLHAFADRLRPHAEARPAAGDLRQGHRERHRQAGDRSGWPRRCPTPALAILSGPSFARDVARGLPTAVTIAAESDLAARLQAAWVGPTFRPYASDDLTGVALGGAAKNVYAIACGVVEGMGLGENARAALLARSFAELARLGEALGARRETLMGLSGLGDLVLTATSRSSRNFSFGVELGQGKSVAELSAPGRPLAEGVDHRAGAGGARAKRWAWSFPSPKRWPIC